jgi:hypothetical protein
VTAAAARLSVAGAAAVRREHVDRTVYRAWVWRHIRASSVRSARLKAYDEFVARWPRLEDFFVAPLRQRLFDRDDCVPGQNPHGGPSVIMPYLSYLSLVRGIGLDYELLFGRTFASPFTTSVHPGGLGVDVAVPASRGTSGAAWLLAHRGQAAVAVATGTDAAAPRRSRLERFDHG